MDTSETYIKMCELTLKILDDAISQIEKFNEAHEIIGFRLHPNDLRNIKEGVTQLYCLTNNKIMVTPPYKGMILVSDNTVLPGFPKPIRRQNQIERIG